MKVAEDLCRALGVDIDKRGVTKVVLTIEAGELPTIAVTSYVDAKVCDELQTVVERLQRIPHDQPDT